MTDKPDAVAELVEELAPLLDDALGEPCSCEMAAKIYRAILPILTAREASARAEGRREGIEEAAEWLEDTFCSRDTIDVTRAAARIRALAEKQP